MCQCWVVTASVHDRQGYVGNALWVHTETCLNNEVYHVVQSLGMLTVAQLLERCHDVTRQWHVLTQIGRIALTSKHHLSCLAHKVATCQTLDTAKCGVRPYIIPHLLLLVFIVAEQQVWQICTQVPCKLHDVTERGNAQGVFQQLPSELTLGNLLLTLPISV